MMRRSTLFQVIGVCLWTIVNRSVIQGEHVYEVELGSTATFENRLKDGP